MTRYTSPSGGLGAELYAEVTLESRRGDSARDVAVRFTLSEDLRISLDDELLGEQTIPEVEGASSLVVRQRITIPNVTPGLYSVICEVDPNLELEDFSLSNNVTRAPFTVGAACVDDDERENEGPRTATELEWTQPATGYEGVICALTEDWYLVSAPAGTHTFTLNAPSADLDLSVYRGAELELLGQGATTADPEQVRVMIPSPTELYIRVDGFFDAEGAYVLNWTSDD